MPCSSRIFPDYMNLNILKQYFKTFWFLFVWKWWCEKKAKILDTLGSQQIQSFVLNLDYNLPLKSSKKVAYWDGATRCTVSAN